MIVVRSCEVERVYTSGEMYARTGDTRPPGRDRRERPQQGPQSGKIVTYAEVDKEIQVGIVCQYWRVRHR